MSVRSAIHEGIDLLKQAVQRDNAADYPEALRLYLEGVGKLLNGLKYEKNQKCQQILRTKIEEIVTRAETLKECLSTGSVITPRITTNNDSQCKIVPVPHPSIVQHKPGEVKWDDIPGLEAAKESVRESIILPLKYPQLFTGLRPRRRILIYGPPGKVKFDIAKAVASECNCNLFSVSCNDLLSVWIEEAERILKNLFQIAKDNTPCILFIDQVEALSTDGSDARRRLKTEFLVQLESQSNDMFVLNSTDYPESIDYVIQKRFDKRIFVQNPGETQEQLFTDVLKSLKRGKKEESPWKSVRWLWIGKMKEGHHYCNLAKLPRELVKVIAEFLRPSKYNILDHVTFFSDKLELQHWFEQVGGPVAQYYFGVYLESIENNPGGAVEWYKKSATAGYSTAQHTLAIHLYNAGNVTEAVSWFQKAADSNHVECCYNLAVCYERGIELVQDWSNAVTWYRKAAEQGDINAQCRLASCFKLGLGVSKDLKQSIFWYEKAADQASVQAYFQLGLLYEEDDIKDMEKAVYWYHKAANHDYSAALYNLSLCYLGGHGVRQDYQRAMQLVRQAAEIGLDQAQFLLGYWNHNGLDGVVAVDLEQAMEWFKKAAEQGHERAKGCLTRPQQDEENEGWKPPKIGESLEQPPMFSTCLLNIT